MASLRYLSAYCSTDAPKAAFAIPPVPLTADKSAAAVKAETAINSLATDDLSKLSHYNALTVLNSLLTLYNSFALFHRSKGDFNTALLYLRKALESCLVAPESVATHHTILLSRSRTRLNASILLPKLGQHRHACQQARGSAVEADCLLQLKTYKHKPPAADFLQEACVTAVLARHHLASELEHTKALGRSHHEEVLRLYQEADTLAQTHLPSDHPAKQMARDCLRAKRRSPATKKGQEPQPLRKGQPNTRSLPQISILRPLPLPDPPIAHSTSPLPPIVEATEGSRHVHRGHKSQPNLHHDTSLPSLRQAAPQRPKKKARKAGKEQQRSVKSLAPSPLPSVSKKPPEPVSLADSEKRDELRISDGRQAILDAYAVMPRPDFARGRRQRPADEPDNCVPAERPSPRHHQHEGRRRSDMAKPREGKEKQGRRATVVVEARASVASVVVEGSQCERPVAADSLPDRPDIIRRKIERQLMEDEWAVEHLWLPRLREKTHEHRQDIKTRPPDEILDLHDYYWPSCYNYFRYRQKNTEGRAAAASSSVSPSPSPFSSPGRNISIFESDRVVHWGRELPKGLQDVLRGRDAFSCRRKRRIYPPASDFTIWKSLTRQVRELEERLRRLAGPGRMSLSRHDTMKEELRTLFKKTTRTSAQLGTSGADVQELLQQQQQEQPQAAREQLTQLTQEDGRRGVSFVYAA
ncbi:unnamed protein product [Vitrella brassicaformis CCMP3155]|uniref:Uncharacterized protein n=1 Tax=Vitrella brassicaformis (strain CCMP3155) TaxID=1169540 RepID=A0A0G4G1M3_VITBC|nr:unnamed protein product [Vitrella brassicaformis CCMP3155]|eukprot:CEM21611.1 unnamed protein product [Vitrella brassicaformis CCMP3155]